MYREQLFFGNLDTSIVALDEYTMVWGPLEGATGPSGFPPGAAYDPINKTVFTFEDTLTTYIKGFRRQLKIIQTGAKCVLLF